MAAGDEALSADWNDTFDAIYDQSIKVLATDLTGGSTGSASYTKIAEVSVAANSVTTYILISVLARAQTGTNGEDINLDIRVGETGSEASVNDSPFLFKEAPFGDAGGEKTSTIEYYYTPTSAEKTNGFNVQIYGRASGGAGTLETYQLIVKGA